MAYQTGVKVFGRPPRGGRGLKFIKEQVDGGTGGGRPPRGGRGLKFDVLNAYQCRLLSPSSRRAWIEIIAKRRSV